MSDLFPHAMFVSRRALCPQCGAPVPLEGQGVRTTCSYCGTVSCVERRLRTNEPEATRRPPVDWTPSHLLPGEEEDRAACGACGAELVFEGDQDRVACRGCGSVSKVERRMRRIESEVALDAAENRSTVELLHRLATSTDLAERVALAKSGFDSWQHVNDTMAGRVGELMAILEDADPRLAHASGEIICKLLCQGNPLYVAAVLAAAQPHLLHPRTSRVLLWNLGLGPGLCMKRLLDAADVHGRNGDLERAGTALWAANTLLGRNYPDHPRIAEIVLYRMLYLHGPVLGWALQFARGQGGVGYRYSAPVLLRFVDDCALERPELVPEIRRSFYDTRIENASDYKARLDLYRALATHEAKATLLGILPAPPKGTGLRVVKEAHEVLVAALDEPVLAADATKALLEQMKEGVPAAIHALVKERKDALPEALRRAYLEKVKDSPHLAKLPPKYWESEKPEPRPPEIEEAERASGESVKRAVDLWNREAQSLSRYWEIIRERTPLMIAAGRGEVAAIERLRAASDVNVQNSFGRTALMFAAENGHADAVRVLGGDPSLRDKEGNTAIMLAALEGHVETVRALLGDESIGQEALRVAFKADRTDVLRVLLESGADPDALEEDGSTPLMDCAKRGRINVATVLLDAKAELDHQDNSGRSALMHAAEAGRADVVGFLLERGASVELTTPEDDAALDLAARAGHAPVVELLAGRVADVNRKGKGGKSPLACADERGHVEVARILARRGATLAGDEKLLVEAVEKKDEGRVRMLLDAGMSASVREDGRSVLYRAINRSKPEIFWLLLDRGAEVDAEVLVRLVVVGWKEAIERVLATGISPDLRREGGDTALMCAAMKGMIEIAQLLLSKGADPKTKDARGMDSRAFAKERRDNDAMTRLLGG